MPVQEQRIIFAGRQLVEERTLSAYGIDAGLTLHMVGRLRGCDFCCGKDKYYLEVTLTVEDNNGGDNGGGNHAGQSGDVLQRRLEDNR